MKASSLAFNSEALAARLDSGISQMGLAVTAEQQALLMAYLALLHKWNHAYNLSGIRDPERMVTLHLLDSLAILPHVDAGTALDVGTGAGLPGIPLAICRPGQEHILLDSNGKKTRFLFQVVSSLKLDNVEVVNARIENFQSNRQIDIVLSRAYASLKNTVEGVDHLLSSDGIILAMKGVFPQEELDELPADWVMRDSYRLDVPGEPGARQLIRIGRKRGADH